MRLGSVAWGIGRSSVPPRGLFIWGHLWVGPGYRHVYRPEPWTDLQYVPFFVPVVLFGSSELKVPNGYTRVVQDGTVVMFLEDVAFIKRPKWLQGKKPDECYALRSSFVKMRNRPKNRR